MITGITDAMMQYERANEEMLKKYRRKHQSQGIRLPESHNVIGALCVLFLVFVVLWELA
ncbi:MAG: hypothetical protein A4E45_02293 [Methanosaeta sp. PtaB.Bin039]|nr:MAG: hypothetical protein A4E45_02293 [Methanosaeta sp. PtaB.Bin039]OPY46632.1 MAG: hypothetical protein A4E47_00538 [Methanosaeta sp. PtaU1.Bin028]HOT05991.1 hypothetical protein [Methanotrichaceae archaeon]HQF16805.1 hypothetical protein [Methanotrichaceae archaeon]HQI90131.1 hypothetical protein [Methanotrichaceae archaeon]